MGITAGQRKALEAQGYTLSKNGKTVLKNGQSIGGINENGKFWSGSQKVMSILKSGGEAPKQKPVVKSIVSKKNLPKEKPVAKDPMKGYRKGDVTTTKIPKDKTNKMRGDARTTAGVRKTAERALAKNAAKKDQPRDWLQRKLNSSGVVYGVTKTR